MLSRYVTSFIVNILGGGPRNLRTSHSRLFHATSFMRKKKNRYWGKKEEPELKIIRPDDCSGSPKAICDPKCKVAIVVGGSDGFGFAAASHLLCKGARNIVIVDNDFNQGFMAQQKLCNSYGKDRVLFIEADLNNVIHFESALQQAVCKHKKVDIIFNDLDKDWHSESKICDELQKPKNNTAIAIQAGLKILGKNLSGFGGTIINCASIFGFLGWPQEPFPIYCKKEPVIEVTMDCAKEYKFEETGVRIMALCPANKSFAEIGLPDLPEPIPNKRVDEMPLCMPESTQQIGSALSYVLAWANNGSVWLVEPAFCAREIPRLIHFPAAEGEKIDPKIYEATQSCSVRARSPCVDTSKACTARDSKICKKKNINPKIGGGTDVF